LSDLAAHRADLPGRLIKHVLYPMWAAKNRSSRLRYLKQLEASQYWSTQTLLDQQWMLFKGVVAHAFETCPYYRQKFSLAGLHPDDLRSRDDVDLVPTITKEEIQEHLAGMVSSKYRIEGLIRDMTGGSTGSPMQFYYDKDRDDSRVAAMLRHNRWAGWDIGDRAAILWGAQRDTRMSGRLRDRIRTWIQERRLTLDASALNEVVMAEFARALISYQPSVLLAYANTLGLFARYVKAEGIVGIRPGGIICSAEVLTEENRRLIEEVFGCPVFNRYGSREFAMIASECEAHQGMHINAENLLVETISEGCSCTGEDGELVITDLRNFAMPMIRYRIRDVGRIKQTSCSCPRGLPVMEVSGGRVTDFLRATNGNKVSGVVISTYVVTSIPGIRQIQFVQNEPGSVTVNLVKGPEWTAGALNELIARTHTYLGNDMRVQLEFRDQIPLEKSGKYRFSISTLA
jgi:phenylacetate-CoA ligase